MMAKGSSPGLLNLHPGTDLQVRVENEVQAREFHQGQQIHQTALQAGYRPATSFPISRYQEALAKQEASI